MSELGEVPSTRRIVGLRVTNKPTSLLTQLQWNDTNKAFEFVAASGGLTSEQFYQDKIVAGDSFQVSGAIDAITDTITFVPATLKTAFIIEAKITMKTNPTIAMPGATSSSTTNDQVVADLKIDGVVKSKAKIGSFATGRNLATGTSSSQGAGLAPFGESFFQVKMLSLVGDGVKAITVENVLDSGSAFAEMSGYVITT